MEGDILIPLAILAGLGLLFGVILSLAYKQFKVFEDPRIDMVEEMLPNSNCGACGEPGCRAFAEKVVNENTNPAKCTVSSDDGITKIADYLGVEASKEEKIIARLLCAGGINEAHNLANYKGGISTCRGETVVVGGSKDCAWGCLGLGDCETACDFEAIAMNTNGLPVVNSDKCTACNDCVEECPKGLFVLMPIGQKLIVQCKSLLEGDLAESKCSVACTGCSRCVADSAPGVIEIIDNLAVVNYKLNNLTTAFATKRCPTDAIVWLAGNNQFEPTIQTGLPLGRVEEVMDKEEYYQ
ncbi:MAG: RnfABCDGE type electron transport complex subunit B [Cyclobacteriaceae bacterium]|nr:RnfABCDGE type electron transport complex subunit B [Cyclobacteriaceae bacterium]